MRRHPLLQSREDLLNQARFDFQDRSIGPIPTGLKKILLTGATGFIGAHVLETLLKRTEANVYCVVRAPDTVRARERLNQRLAGLNIVLSESQAARIACMSGDVSMKRLALTDHNYRFLLQSIDSIFHLAASINWLSPFGGESVRNIDAMREILGLLSSGRRKVLNYASSMGVHATLADPLDRDIPEDYRLTRPQTLYGGYCQTKWINEEICAKAREKGALINVFRIGDVKGRARDGAWDPNNFGNQFMLTCMKLGMFPKIATRFNFLPVDFIAESIVALAQKAVNQNFQFNSSRLAGSMELHALLSRKTRIELVDESIWRNRLCEADDYAPAKAIRPIFTKLSLDMNVQQKSFFDIGTHLYLRAHQDVNTREVLGERYNHGFDIEDIILSIEDCQKAR